MRHLAVVPAGVYTHVEYIDTAIKAHMYLLHSWLMQWDLTERIITCVQYPN